MPALFPLPCDADMTKTTPLFIQIAAKNGEIAQVKIKKDVSKSSFVHLLKQQAVFKCVQR